MSSTGYHAPRRELNGGVLAASILATLFCCLPFGIVAIVQTARGEPEKATPWLIASAVLGVIGWFVLLANR